MTPGGSSSAAVSTGGSVVPGHAFHDAVTGMAICDLEGRYQLVNPALCRMLGRSEPELIGLLAVDLTHPDDRSDSQAAFETLAAGAAATDQHRKRYLRPDGSSVVVVRTLTVLRDAAGAPTSCLVQVLDVTEAAAAEEALHRSERRSRALLAQASELTVLVDRESRIVYASPASERLMGHLPSDLEGRSVFDFLHSEEIERAGMMFATHLAQALPPTPVGYRLLHRDGSWRLTAMVVTNLLDDPDVAALVVNVRDVTEERAYQDQVEASERRLRSLVAHSWDVITLHGRDGRYLYVSPAVTGLLGYAPEELVGADPSAHVHPDDAGTARAFGAAAAGGEIGTVVQYRFRHRDGSWRWLESTAHDRFEDPAIGGMVVTSRDITARRRRAAQQDAVAALSGDALRGGAIDDLFARAVELVAGVLDVEHCAILQVDGDGRLAVAARVGPPLLVDPYEPERDGRPVTMPAAALRDRASIVWGADDTPAELDPAFARRGLRSGAATVIVDKSEPFGVLTVRSTAAGGFSRADLSFLEVTANVLGATIGRHRVEGELRRRALHDDLTGLPNRVALLDRLTAALARLARQRAHVAVLFVDTDDFKIVNDTLGHVAGDHVVGVVAGRILAVLRGVDTVSRFGGDEFVVLCEHTDAATASAVAERIRLTVAEPIQVDGHGVVVTASIGIAVTDDPSLTAHDLLAQADTAMYAAKGEGKDRSVIFDVAMRRLVTERFDTDAGLRRALAAGELRLHFQPVVRTATGEIVGSEALLRWEHPSEGLLGPDRIIGHAEASGLIVPIGRWVLEHACRQVAAWQASGLTSSVAVNVSARQLAQPDIVDTVAGVLQVTGAHPYQVNLEVTESAVMADLDRAARVIDELRALGLRVGMDDFGTGASSLSYLANLSFDFVKVDRSFITAFDRDRRAAALLETIATLCRALDLDAIAEGIETTGQLDRVRTLGIELGQGYLFGRPVPACEFPHRPPRAPDVGRSLRGGRIVGGS